MKPYYEDGLVTLWHGDALEILPTIAPVDAVVTDPPYGETALEWDIPVSGWLEVLPTKSLWCFGSLRMFMREVGAFTGWRLAQEVVWEKHNGSGPAAERFLRVHELIGHFYFGKWSDIYHEAQTTPDAVAKTVKRKGKPEHRGAIGEHRYESYSGGPRLMRSVLRVRSCHGEAQHPTQKPVALLEHIVEYSVPWGGEVLDPFAGVGSTLLAARNIGCQAIGIEINERYCEIAAKRLAQGALDFGKCAP